jgi:hypothetical protein
MPITKKAEAKGFSQVSLRNQLVREVDRIREQQSKKLGLPGLSRSDVISMAFTELRRMESPLVLFPEITKEPS